MSNILEKIRRIPNVQIQDLETLLCEEQMKMLNTHTRYLHENILDYTEELLQTTPDEIDRAMYMCTGSEANDLAIRIAREYSGGTGIIVSQESYHGTSSLTSGCSPASPCAPRDDGHPVDYGEQLRTWH